MTSANNTIILNGCITEFKDQNELTLSDSDLFEFFATMQIAKDYDLSFEDAEVAIVDGSQDGGIDTVLLMVNERPITALDDL